MVGRQRYRSLYYDRDGEKRVHSTHTQGIYALQIRQRLRAGSRGRFESFATYGGTGYYDFITEAPATPLIFSDGRTVLGRNERQTGVIPPVATTVGFGIQQQLGRHVALRADAQLLAVLVIPFGFRASGTVSVPLGKYP
jgi:hypothetical protein